MKTLNFIALVFLILSCTHGQRNPSSEASPDYVAIFAATRDLLVHHPSSSINDKSAKELKKIPEHQVVGEFQRRPELLQENREKLITEIEALSQEKEDLTKPLRLIPPAGQPGYRDLKLHVNHPYLQGKKIIPAENLIEVWKKFIHQAKKEIVVNVFDFDLEDVAEVLMEKARNGLYVRVGIDKKSVIDIRPEVKKVEQMLIAAGVHVTGVHPVGLNHQKITAIDWSDVDHAAVLFSSGNLTNSCMNPDGDLHGTVPLPKESLPNANHLLTMKSWLLANLVHHEMTKTLDPKYLLRGRQYPLNGAYQVTGEGVDPQTLEAYPEPSVIISFTPGGGLKSVNKNIIAELVKRETGWVRMLQFAYSSKAVDEALLFRAVQDYQVEGSFDFKSIGDTPFAMREWSRFLLMSGMKRLVDENKRKTYLDDPENIWSQSLTPEQLQDLRSKVLVAPKVYGNNWVRVQGKNVKVNAKIHHKILATPRFAILGTSFNFSEGAESNNEQILVFRDTQLASAVHGMVDYLSKDSPGSVHSEGLRRNSLAAEQDDEDEETVIENYLTPSP